MLYLGDHLAGKALSIVLCGAGKGFFPQQDTGVLGSFSIKQRHNRSKIRTPESQFFRQHPGIFNCLGEQLKPVGIMVRRCQKCGGRGQVRGPQAAEAGVLVNGPAHGMGVYVLGIQKKIARGGHKGNAPFPGHLA